MTKTGSNMLSIQRVIIFAFLFLIAQALLLASFGQPWICTCGYVKLWEGVVLSSGNSQHIFDWYTFSHITHGFLFYFLAWICLKRYPIGLRFLFALGIECAWEVIENTPMVIEHYRQQALAQGYVGDSVINSVFDSLAMILGFLMAWRFPVWTIILIACGLELWTAYAIRDNLTLNIINLIYVFPQIKAWQMGIYG